jgi:hypothetical protein
MKITNVNRVAGWLVLAMSFCLVTHARAGAESAFYARPDATGHSPAEASPWEVRIGVPLWLPTISGEYTIRGVTSSLDFDSRDDLSSLDGFFSLSIYVRYQRWEFFGEGFYIDTSDDVEVPRLRSARADLSFDSGFAQGFVGYRVLDSPKGYLSLFAGARYNHMGGDLQIFDNGDPQFPLLRLALGIPSNLQVSGSRNWVDPVVGLKGKAQLWKPIWLWVKGDVGGFGLNSGTAYAIDGGIEFQITRYFWLQTGWSYLKNDFSSGGFSNETELSGPLVQLGFSF